MFEHEFLWDSPVIASHTVDDDSELSPDDGPEPEEDEEFEDDDELEGDDD